MRKRIPLDRIEPNPKQPRRRFDETALRGLADSILMRGLMQAITVRPLPGGERYQIIAGERRWRAHCLLASEGHLGPRPEILCEVVQADDDETALQAITENLARADVTPMEEARAFQAMLDRGWSVERLAKDLGLSQAWRIRDRTRLLALEESIQQLVEAGQFPVGHANEIADLPRHDQLRIVQLFTQGRISGWSGIKAAAQAVRDRRDQDGLFGQDDAPSPEDRAALDRMERLVTRVTSSIASGFKDGEFIAIKTVDPNHAEKLADMLALSARTLRSMEAQLRAAHARARLI